MQEMGQRGFGSILSFLSQDSSIKFIDQNPELLIHLKIYLRNKLKEEMEEKIEFDQAIRQH